MLIEILGNNPDIRKIKQVVNILKKGGVAVIPTDTIYAFVASLHSKKGMDKLAKIKKVKLKKSQFSLICEDLSHISSYTLPMDRSVFRILSNSLPGPFTFILNASNKVSKLFSTNRKEVGVRIPNHNIPKEIVKKLGHPLISSSVHNEDEILEYNTDPNSIFDRFGNEVDIIVDCGYGKNIASTIVDCTNVDISILRQGMGILDD